LHGTIELLSGRPTTRADRSHVAIDWLKRRGITDGCYARLRRLDALICADESVRHGAHATSSRRTGDFSALTDVVERIGGRRPGTIDDFIRRHAASFRG